VLFRHRLLTHSSPLGLVLATLARFDRSLADEKHVGSLRLAMLVRSRSLVLVSRCLPQSSQTKDVSARFLVQDSLALAWLSSDHRCVTAASRSSPSRTAIEPF
jgi:hypothetical protein